MARSPRAVGQLGEGTEQDDLRRQVRIVGILSATERAGTSPLPAADLHLIAYFADALAPVWGLEILDAQLLKRQDGPMSPALQRDVDLLVGRGLVDASSISHARDAAGEWRLVANYALNDRYSPAVLDRIGFFPEQVDELAFLREVVFAISSLGLGGMPLASHSDAAYGDEVVANGRMVDIAEYAGRENVTARVALRFGELLRPDVELAPAEMIHLYIRELYGRLRAAA